MSFLPCFRHASGSVLKLNVIRERNLSKLPLQRRVIYEFDIKRSSTATSLVYPRDISKGLWYISVVYPWDISLGYTRDVSNTYHEMYQRRYLGYVAKIISHLCTLDILTD